MRGVIWLLVGEDLMHVRFGEAVKYLPGYAGPTMSGAANAASLAPTVAAVVLLGWVVAALISAAALLHRCDVA